MELFLWAFGCAAVIAFLWLTILNWRVFWQRHIRGVESTSWIPLLAGLSGVAAMLLLPVNWSGFWWLPLLIDWGSAPGLIYSAIWYTLRKQA